MADKLHNDPEEKLKARYNALIEQASSEERQGNIENYIRLTKKADAIWQQIEGWEIEQGHS
jgi:hypothetical protein